MEIIKFEHLPSTNDYLMDYCKENEFKNGLCVTCEVQTKGKGRNGRIWSSFDGGLYLSTVYNTNTSIMPFITCNAVIDTLMSLGFDAFAKWPNDIVVDKKKVCGILCESVFFGSLRKFTVCGMGINLNNKEFSQEIEKKATSLHLLSSKLYSKDEIIKEIIRNFDLWTKRDEDDIIDHYKKRCISLNKEVYVVEENCIARGIDIDNDGSLIVEYKDGTRKNIRYGDVSIRGVGGYVD